MIADEVVDEYVTRPAAPALRGVVAPYSGYRQQGVAPAVHRGLPSPYVTVVFTLDEPLDIAAHSDPSQTPGHYDALVGGLHTSPVLIRHDGSQSGVQLSVDPLWARQVFGLPGGELAGLDVHAAELLGPTATRILDRLRAASDWSARFDVLDSALLTLLADTPSRGVAPEVVHAWTRLRRTGGLAPIGCLADETGWSDRHLANRFRAETGLTPKTAGRVIRFDRARRAAQSGTFTFADVAATHGYYDQSHLVRDFRELTGLAPTRWLATEGNLQETS